MKTTMMVFTLLALTSGPLLAENERRTLISDIGQVSGFGGMEASVGDIGGGTNALMGGYGAALFNERFYLGGGGKGSVRTVEGTDYQFGYGGLLMGYFTSPRSLVHGDISLMLGAGGLADTASMGGTTGHNHNADAFFVAEPRIAMAMNLAPFTKFTLGVSYRFVEGVNVAGVSNKDLSGFSVTTSAIFGRF